MTEKQKEEFDTEFRKYFPHVLDIEEAIKWRYISPSAESNDRIWFATIQLQAIAKLSEEQLLKLGELSKKLVVYF